jgi:hypothetical protein
MLNDGLFIILKNVFLVLEERSLKDTNITLNPMQIRTFRVTLK